MCVRLADFLRSSLRLGERLSIPFSEELALTQTHLGVEQIRFGERLRFVQDVEQSCADCEVPPLVIQPLVENAIKHGIATLVSGGSVSIAARCAGDTMKIVIENDFDPEAPAGEKSGFGIANVRNRLEARYGGAASLDASVVNGAYRVTLSAPCKRHFGKERA
jgi:LytS/YehU family sensor histidine kinase